MNSELLDFTRQALAQKIERPAIATALRQAGWAEAEVKAALDSFADIDFPLAVPKPKPYLSAREVFVYLLLFSALYTTAYNLGALAFEFIDRAFPDPLQANYFRWHGDDEAVRWNLSALIVAFPLFLFTFRAVRGAIARDPTKRSSRPRKWLTYLTLSSAALSLTGDLIMMVYSLLGGELTVRFTLKAATVAVIAGGGFAYFLTDIRKEETA